MLMQKGTAMKSTLKYIQGKLEGERLQAFIGGLPEDLRGFFKKSVFASEWYPGVPMAQIMEHFARFLGEPPHEVYWAMGRQSSDDGLNTVYKIFIRLGNPEFIIRKAPYVWTTYYSEGAFETRLTPPNGAVLTLNGCPIPHEAICTRVGGWMQRTLEHSGAKSPQVRHAACTLKGQANEEWVVSWDK